MSDRRAWEYAILVVSGSEGYWYEGSGQMQEWGSSIGQVGVNPRVGLLDEAGANGWELVAAFYFQGSSEYTFKRPA